MLRMQTRLNKFNSFLEGLCLMEGFPEDPKPKTSDLLALPQIYLLR